MTDDQNPFVEWLPKVIADPIEVNASEDGLNKEAYANVWSFGFSREQLASVTEDDIVQFVRTVEEARERQILERFGSSHPMVLYCWVDDFAGSLRLGLVSTVHGKLPFRTQPETTDDLGEIARAYLNCLYLDGIPFEEFTVLTEEDLGQEDLDEEVKLELGPFRVWTSAELPTP